MIVVGDYATPEEVAELKKRFAEENYDVVFVEKDRPYRIDLVVSPKPQFDLWQFYRDNREGKDLPEDFIPPSWLDRPNYWVGKAESDRRYEIFRKLILPYTMNTAYKEAMELDDKVTVSLRFPKQEIMVGEPMVFDYVVRNDSDVDLSITVGGDYRGSGRPTSFTMRAVRQDGDTEKTVYEIPVIMNMGGLMHGENIAANGGEYAFDLCLSCWLELKEPGEYRIDVARHLRPSPEDWMSLTPSTTPFVLRTASGILTVQPFDYDAFGQLIEKWGKQATATDIKYDEREKAVNKLAHVEDERVIPWLIQIESLHALTKFNDDAALAAIAKDIDSSDNNKSHSSAANLSRSVHPEAVNILLKHQDHPNYSVRLTVVQAAQKMEREVALEMLRQRFNDPGWEGNVGKEARRIYTEITGEE